MQQGNPFRARVLFDNHCGTGEKIAEMTSFFEKLLVRQKAQKAQQNRWMDPSGGWGQNEGL